ncbi:MAG TPA: HAMP domain-containing sensor histidine kinase [bacterium]|nr:HAMP domain-containing sensor histidine kinase [bacterium]HPN29743.1 HAMP domain-containing sensor histidine kinase [bacterium]
MKKKIPFKLKLIFILFVTLSLIFAVQIFTVNHYSKKFAMEYENSEMKEYSELCQKIYFNELELNNAPQLDVELEHFYFQVRDSKNKILYSSPKIKNLTPENFILKDSQKNFYYFNQSVSGSLFRFYIEKKYINNKFYDFIYFISLNKCSAFVNKINILFIVISVLLIFILYFISNLFVNKILSPVDQIINDVKKINIKNLSGRIENVDSNDTIEKLTNTFNMMIQNLENSFNRINQFFSDFSHEMKNPLTVIKNGLELVLKSKKLSDEDSNILSRLYKTVEAVQQMTGELLFLAKADSDAIKLNYTTVKLKEIVSFAEDIGKIMTEEKGIIFSINYTDEDLDLYIDEHKIKQIIINLLNNAVEYVKPCGIITLDFFIKTDTFIIKVQDNGTGISKEDLPYIFDRFYRCDKSRSREKHHFGLGLSIVKMNIELHKGSVRIDSELNKGTTVTVEAPINLNE